MRARMSRFQAFNFAVVAVECKKYQRTLSMKHGGGPVDHLQVIRAERSVSIEFR